MSESDKTVLFIIGTRPEAIKLSPVILEAKAVGTNVLVALTGQQPSMAKEVLTFFGIEWNFEANIIINEHNVFIAAWVGKCLTFLDLNIGSHRNTISDVVVQGDTSTAFVGAYWAFLNKINVFHVEAGLRTNDIQFPFPEEGNRQLISRIASFNFAPTENAAQNLENEGVATQKIGISGNTSIDALRIYRERTNPQREIESSSIMKNTKTKIIVTCHRRENFGEPMKKIFSAVQKLAKLHQNYEFIVVKHTNPEAQRAVENFFPKGVANNIIVVSPLSYPEMLTNLKDCALVITDSGGLQEEVPSFGIVAVVTREETERPEGIKSGHLVLVGSNEQLIIKAVNDGLKRNDISDQNPYGDGFAAKRIMKVINEYSN